ncbi:MAG: hemolysin III family protein [Pyrinomonadaceae bacterium]|nr:hemolysin III family protein [Pyrinomonadaceae bacterium]MBP6212814.1 hemolysin III family protein [Pyrinomonadaceae bacterium]
MVKKRIKSQLDILSVEEFANTLTHGFGLLLSIAGFLALVVYAGTRGDKMLIAACVVYGLSLVTLYGASTMYHSATSPKLKKTLQIVDHCCIYLLIAGSYTPFGLVIAGDSFGRALMAAIWGFALVGIIVKLLIRDRFPAINVLSYLIMGWLGIFAVQPLFNVLGFMPVALTIAGGVAYTLGVIFFPWKSIKHHHAIFHVFILAGSILHYAAVMIYIVPHTTNL